MCDPLELERAWAAGLFDGEGSTSLNRKSGHNHFAGLRLDLNQKDRRVLDRFAMAVGRGRIFGPYTYGKGGASTRFAYCAHNETAREVLALLWPYLSEIKRDQAVRAFAEIEDERRYLCEHCGVAFVRATRRERFCSNQCQRRIYYEENKHERWGVRR